MTAITAYPLLSEADSLANEGKLEQAAQQVMAHLRQHPDEPRGLAQLGFIATQLGALGQAELFLRRAVAKGAIDFEVRRCLASVLNQQERLEEALSMFHELEQKNGDPALKAVRASILAKLGRHDEAIIIQEGLARTHDDQATCWVSFGHALRAEGRVADAIDAYRHAIAADYENGEAWWGLASIKQRVLTDEDIENIRKAIAIAVDVRHSAPLHFALARALHDRARYKEAFAHYAEANRQRAEELGYDAQELTDEISEIERVFDRDLVTALDREPSDEPVPIFIVSLPRSGSTLLEQMLGSHHDIEPVGELPYIPAILRSVVEMATRRGRVTVPQLVARLSSEQAATIGRDYLHRASLHRKTSRRFFVDKLPHNWSNILFIRRILPQALFIDIRRDPMDCCFSNFTQSFSSAHASSFTLHDIGQCYVDYTRLMAHLDHIAPGMVHHVSYERLVENAETEIRAVLNHLGLPWDPSVLEFHKLKRVVRTPSTEQVRRPLNRDGMEIWTPYAEWLGPLREVLGPLANQ